MRLIFDQNVPESVVEYLAARGHEHHRVRDLVAVETPDEVIAAIGDRLDAVVVTWDKDFKALASKIPEGARARFRKLGRILFQCSESQGRNRLEQVIELLDFAFEHAQQRRDKRFMMVIGASSVRFEL